MYENCHVRVRFYRTILCRVITGPAQQGQNHQHLFQKRRVQQKNSLLIMGAHIGR